MCIFAVLATSCSNFKRDLIASPMCASGERGVGSVVSVVKLLWFHVLLLVGVLSPSLRPSSHRIATAECPFKGTVLNLLSVCPMRRLFAVSADSQKTCPHSAPPKRADGRSVAPVTRVLSAMARTTYLLQLHVIVIWGFLMGTTQAFQCSGGGCPLRGAFSRGPSSVLGRTASSSSGGHRLAMTRSPLRSPTSLLGGSDLRSELEAQSQSRLYMGLGSFPREAPPAPKGSPIKSKTKKKSRVARSSSLTLEGALRTRRSEARQHLPEIVVIGVSHRHCPVEVREQLAIPEEQWNEASSSLCEADSIDEAFVLSTCNRFEVYVAGKNEYDAMTDALQFLHARTDGTVDQETLRKHMFVLTGEDAIFHLMRVSAGLDSMVLGEAQIQCQVKKAFTRSCAEDGRGGLVLKQMLESALRVGRRVRSETEICKGAVSVSSAAVEFTALKMQQQADQQRSQQVQHDVAGEETLLPTKSLTNSNVVIVGAGKMARLLLVHLKSKKVRTVTVVNRSPDRVLKLQEEFKDMHIEYRHMEQLWSSVQEADVVYPCTSSATPIITPAELQTCMDKRAEKRRLDSAVGAVRGARLADSQEASPTSRAPSCPVAEQAETAADCSPSVLHFTPELPLRFVDLSVPRNVDPSCASQVQGVECYNVDDLKEVVQENTARRQGEMSHAEDIIREEISNYQRWQESLGAIPTMTRLREKAEEMRLQELEKCTQRLAQLSPDELRSVDHLSRGIVGKLLSGPMEHLRKADQASESGAAVAQVQQAFHAMLKA
mmetsp:Transcript_26166/g.49112  ORF Transcript_26166/g.49112 Transcript_26166/m.49112 type:complete len:773 (-) Transcript_26166:296-2614(-)